jgi:hypothetical protein
MVDISDAFVVGVWFFDQNCFGYVGEDIIFSHPHSGKYPELQMPCGWRMEAFPLPVRGS